MIDKTQSRLIALERRNLRRRNARSTPVEGKPSANKRLAAGQK